MNVLLWILQILLAVHALIGAVWKLSHSAQTLPSLQAIPAGAWLSLCVGEIICSVALVAPLFNRSLSFLAPTAALFFAAEMLLFVFLHVMSGQPGYKEMIYWLVVAALCAVVAYGRLRLVPA